MRKLVLLLLVGAFPFAAYALAARFVLHGPVTARSLVEAVEEESGSAGTILGTAEPCRRLRAVKTWECSVLESSGSGGVDYEVRVRNRSSYGEGGLPTRISGCVYRWRRKPFDLR